MNETQSIESKASEPVCAQCGSRLSSTDGTESCCVSCLLRAALGDDDLNDAGRPHRFDQYELITDDAGTPVELGRGAMGVTYKAFDTNLRCEVALKVIHPRFLADESSRARFLSEARAAAQLRHRNIASVFHLGSERGEYFYTMELVEGETIEDRVRSKGPIDCATALDITLQVTRALIAAGDRKFVHRDVKPSNIMLCTEADGAIVAKLIDFGLVRGITEKFAPVTASPVRQLADRPNPSSDGPKEVAQEAIQTGFIGTPHYASPEQFAGARTDARSDIFSLGVTLWFMLTGKLPFDGAREEIQQKQLAEVLPLRQLKGFPRAVIDLIKRMLDVDPAKRPQSPAVLKEQLHKCIGAIDAARQRQRRKFAYTTAALTALTIAALGASYVLRSKLFPAQTREIVPEKSVAVLPFTNGIPESDGGYLVDGIRAQIAARMAKLPNLRVVSGSATQRYQSAPENPAKVAADLDVTDLLQGSVEKQGDKFRITVRLIDGKKNVGLWSKSYDRTFAKIIETESEVARQAADVLGLKLTEPDKRAIEKPATSNPLANEAYLKGRYVWLQRNLDSFRQAKEYFEQAIALDPNYAPAYAGLADAYQFVGAIDPRDSKENYDKAKRACRSALQLDPTLAEAHASAGLIAMNYDWDWPLAEQELRRAIALDPNNALFYDWYAEYLMAVGRTDESLANMERARELDPDSVLISSDFGKLLFFARRYDEAEEQLKATLRMDPDFTPTHWFLALTYVVKHRFDDAIAESNVPERTPTGTLVWGRGLSAYAYALAGRKQEAEQALERIKKHLTAEADVAVMLAHIALGNKDQAFACLDRDYENHYTTMISLKSNPVYDPLRSDPRFSDLMRRVHLAPGGNAASEVAPEKSIAVLPFDNLGDDKERAFFADGVQDDVLTKLAKVADLKVISRTSTMQYRGKQDPREIGRALGVSHVLEGTVRPYNEKVHVNARLVDTRTDTDVWGEEYDRDLKDIFAIEAELAQTVANQLRANVSAREALAMQEPPTKDLVAYDLYTRAKNLVLAATFNEKVTRDYLLQAADLLNQAVAHDPSFFQAYCQLAQAHDRIYSRGYDRTPKRLAMAEAALQAAFHLRPDAGEMHLARAQDLYEGHSDYDGALHELEIARESLPNDARIFQWMGYVHRRQGHWEESTRNLERAVELNPRDIETLHQTALSYDFFRRYSDEASLLDRALAVEPTRVETKVARAFLDLDWKADTQPLHQVIDEIRARNPNGLADIASEWLVCTLAERDAGAANSALIAGGDTPFRDLPTDRSFVEGLIARMTKEDNKARAAFIAARAEEEKVIQAQPNFGPPWCALGLIDAALGRKEEALREGRRAVDLHPVERDALRGPVMIEHLAMIAAWVGDKDLACKQLAVAVRPPSDVSYGELKLLPYWDPLRGDPRFEKIVASLAPGVSEIAPEKSIAVLPFANQSTDPQNAYFADGIQDEIVTRLSKIADLKVISRTSTQGYKSAPENLPDIGRQLGVANILEGSVQKSGDAVRVNVQLIKADTDSHLWADTFDRKLTDIFSVESELAKAIADRLQAKLTGQEEEVISAKPTENTEAYDAYLRGLAYTLRTSATQANCLSAQKYLREAVRLDPKFALAWALLSYVDADGYLTAMLQPTAALRQEARQAADTALTLQPRLGEALVAKGQYQYACLKDYDTAMGYFEQARPFLPNNSQVPQLLAYVTRRQGQWDRSEAYFNEAERLDPRNVSILAQHALSYIHLRRFPEALRKLDQVLDIIPDDLDTLVSEANIAQAEGDLSRAAALLAPLHTGTDNTDALETQVYQAILERQPEAVIPRLNEILAKPDPSLGYFNGELRFWLGWAQEVAGDHGAAQNIWRQARSELEPFLKEQPENHLLLGYLALTSMSLGDKTAAFALAERAMAVVPIEKDASSGPASIEILARVAARMGEPDRAIAALQKLLSMPYEAPLASNPPLTSALLRLDPMFDPLRNDPRFQKLATTSASK